jgi:hypothetical protein
MKKPAADATPAQWAAYRLWVQAQLKDWDPADDKGGPDVYVPRLNGIRGDIDD